uniref:Zona pellucida sperm-binding protein 3 n=1 Tax=Amphiprion percula TaxID=161767 RepID=A0A3P8SKR3_AMPPE
METLCFGVNLLVGLFLSGICAVAFPPTHIAQHAPFQRAQQSKPSEQQKQQVNTVSVTCHPDSLEITIKADMFAVGAPVNSEELRLGVDHSDSCRAAASSEDEYRIVVGLVDCGTKHWMTEDSLVYTNLLIYAPEASPNGLIRMDEAVIPIECHYERKYSLSSSSLMPTWIPFTSTQAAVETLAFDLRLMTNDWMYERSANVFHLGEPICIEASVRVGHHMGLRVFISSCVATLQSDIYSEPKYIFVENGCLLDSQLPGSKAHFLPRTQDDKLQLVIDAFKFHNDDRGELYITCHLNAVPVNDAEAPNKACTVVNGRWRSADGNDYLCGYCQNEAGQPHSKPSSSSRFDPRGFGKLAEHEPLFKSGLRTNQVWDHEKKLGPVMVLPSRRSGPLPLEELPPVLNKISRTALYGSRWRSGISGPVTDVEKTLLTPPPDLEEEEEDYDDDDDNDDDDKSGKDLKGDDTDYKDAAPLEKASPDFKVKPLPVELDLNATEAPSDVSFTSQYEVKETLLSNTTTAQPDPETTDPKK